MSDVDPKATSHVLSSLSVYGVKLPLLWPKPKIQPGPGFRGQVNRRSRSATGSSGP